MKPIKNIEQGIADSNNFVFIGVKNEEDGKTFTCIDCNGDVFDSENICEIAEHVVDLEFPEPNTWVHFNVRFGSKAVRNLYNRAYKLRIDCFEHLNTTLMFPAEN